jgi:hypothetical protein
VTLTATPAEHYEFTGWSRSSCPGTGPCKLTLERDISVTAGFRRILHTVSVSVTGDGRVNASSPPISGCREGAGTCQGEYREGTELALVAKPDTGQSFTGWSGCDAVAGNTCTLDVGSDKHPVASFTQVEHTSP